MDLEQFLDRIPAGASSDKLYALLEELAGASDAELGEALPIAPPSSVRMALGAASTRIPTDSEQIDAVLLAVAVLVTRLRSDDAPEAAIWIEQHHGEQNGGPPV